MVYTPATDFLGLWRNSGGNVSKTEMPGLDYVVLAFSRAGLISLSVSGTAPVANQATTAWLQPAVPSYSGEGTLHLWNPVTAAYAAASPGLLFAMLQAASGQSGVSIWPCTGGPPANTVGANGDFAIRSDEPGGIFGPKAAGVWPATPLPGSSDVLTSAQMDGLFGVQPGQLTYRAVGAAGWQGLLPGTVNQLLAMSNGLPSWANMSALLDAIFGPGQGSILYRGATQWASLGYGIAAQVLQTNGANANPSWANRTPEFLSGTTMIFQQTAAPTGWTKQVTLNDYGLRVVSGAVGTTSGVAFSTVFAQTSVGNTTITQATMASHSHSVSPNNSYNYNGPNGAAGTGGVLGGSSIITIGSTGSDGPHSHSIALNLAYIDVIIATKN